MNYSAVETYETYKLNEEKYNGITEKNTTAWGNNNPHTL